MSILIKGMEMPRRCAECEIEGHYEDSYGDEYGFFCPMGYKAYTSETRETKRLDDCPLVPVADVVERKRGKWIEDDDGYQICSECGAEHHWCDYRASFCEDCGAEMLNGGDEA